MLTLAAQVLFLVALVRASHFPLQPRSGPCDSSGPDYSERVCGDICLPIGQFCCGNIPAPPSLLYACPIGTVCNDYYINNSDYLARCCEGQYNPPIGALASCQVVPTFPSTSYISGTATAPITAPSSTACGAEVNAEGYGYRDCGNICLDVESICCGFIPGTNKAWSCSVGQACLTSGYAPGNCVDASGYIVPGTTFVASNTTVASSPPSTITTSTVSLSTPTTTSTSVLTTSSTGGSTTTSSSGLTTSSTGSPTTTSESASITAQSTSSSTTSQLPISTTSIVGTGSSSPGIVTSSPSLLAFTGVATRHGPIENGVVYVLGGLIVGAAVGDLGLF
ncbi:hypothetical protein V8E51_014612 [Hyaloscypha variabilis]